MIRVEGVYFAEKCKLERTWSQTAIVPRLFSNTRRQLGVTEYNLTHRYRTTDMSDACFSYSNQLWLPAGALELSFSINLETHGHVNCNAQCPV